MLAQTTQTAAVPSTQQAIPIDWLTSQTATIIGAVLSAAAVVVTGLLNLRYQLIATRYKTFIEIYKIAKDAELTEPVDKLWAQTVLRRIHADTVRKADYIGLILYGLSLYLVAFLAAKVNQAIFNSKPADFWLAVVICLGGAICLVGCIFKIGSDMYRNFFPVEYLTEKTTNFAGDEPGTAAKGE